MIRIVLLYFFIVISNVLLGQQGKIIRSYINGSEYKKVQLKTDSSNISPLFVRQYSTMVIEKSKLVLLLDSIISSNDGYSIYFSLPANFYYVVILNDSLGNVIEKKVFNNYFYLKSMRLFERYLVQLENAGYPFAEIVLDSIFFKQKDSLCLDYKLFKNKAIVYDSIDVIGKPMVSVGFLAAYTGIIPGGRYEEKKIKHFDRLVKDLVFIREKKKSDLFFIDTKAKLRVYIEKQSANNFSGLIGIANGEKNQLLFTGDLTVNLKNIFKHADMWDIAWKKTGEQSQRLDFSLVFPYLFNKPIGVLTKFNLYKQDSTYLNSQLKAGLMFYTQGFNGMSVYFEQRQTSVLKYTSLSFAATNSKYVGLNYIFNKFNKTILPDRGFSFNIDAAYGTRYISKIPQMPDSVYNLLKTHTEQWRGNASFVSLIPLTGSFFAKFACEAGTLSRSQFKNELFRLGGSKSIRGFDEESLYASSYLLTSGELRISLDNATQLFAFYDKLMYRSFIYNDNPWGVGVGAELNTGAGLFYISYALGSQFNQSLAFRNSKIHFGYRNRF